MVTKLRSNTVNTLVSTQKKDRRNISLLENTFTVMVLYLHNMNIKYCNKY